LAGFLALIWSNLCTRYIPDKLTPRGHHESRTAGPSPCHKRRDEEGSGFVLAAQRANEYLTEKQQLKNHLLRRIGQISALRVNLIADHAFRWERPS
jgi:hypothetical protein